MKRIVILVVTLLLQMNMVYAVDNNDISQETLLMKQVETVLKKEIEKGKTNIDLRTLKMKYNDKNQRIILETFKYSPYLYLLYKHNHLYKFSYSQGYIDSIDLNMDYSKEDVQEVYKKVDDQLNEIMQLIIPSMNNYTKALTIHDYLILNYEYDKNISDSSATSGGLFINKKGVCDGYSHAYQYIMNMLGFNCITVSSTQMNHSWNIIEMDNSYYHVDVTWDDPIEDKFGMVHHFYFMLSDKAIQENRTGEESIHHHWESSVKCNDTKYDQIGIKDIQSPIYFYKNHYYYINNKGIMKDSECFHTFNKWFVYKSMNRYWNGIYSGLFIYNDEIYYNEATSIKKMSLDGKNDKEIMKIEDGSIYGIRLNHKRVEYVIKQDPNEKGMIYDSQIKLSKKETISTLEDYLYNATELSLLYVQSVDEVLKNN